MTGPGGESPPCQGQAAWVGWWQQAWQQIFMAQPVLPQGQGLSAARHQLSSPGTLRTARFPARSTSAPRCAWGVDPQQPEHSVSAWPNSLRACWHLPAPGPPLGPAHERRPERPHDCRAAPAAPSAPGTSGRGAPAGGAAAKAAARRGGTGRDGTGRDGRSLQPREPAWGGAAGQRLSRWDCGAVLYKTARKPCTDRYLPLFVRPP